jgi:chromosome segregation ATPase
MPGKTHSDKIDDLYRLVYTLTEQAEELRRDLDRADEEIREAGVEAVREAAEARKVAADALAAARKDFANDLTELRKTVDQLRIDHAVQRRDLDDLRTNRDEWGRRLWGMAQLLIGAAVGGVITYLVKR